MSYPGPDSRTPCDICGKLLSNRGIASLAHCMGNLHIAALRQQGRNGHADWLLAQRTRKPVRQPTPTGDPAAADDAGARRTVYVLMLESAMTNGTAATIEAVYAVREHAEKHAALINERSAVQRARVCVEPLVMEDRYPAYTPLREGQG